MYRDSSKSSGMGGHGGQSATPGPDSEKFDKNREKEGENQEKSGKKRKNREEKAKIGKGSFTLPPRQIGLAMLLSKSLVKGQSTNCYVC